jgi:hypothetical protein
MSELSDALFGVDGTELPEPLPDSSGRGASGLLPLTLPALPDSRMTREEIAVALGEDPTRPVNQDPDAAPAQRGTAPPSATQTDTPPVSASFIGAPPVPVPPITAPPVAPTASLPTHSAPQAPTAGAPGHLARPVAPMMAPPVQPTPGLRYRPPLAFGSRMSRQLDLRRRAGRRGPGVPARPRTNGGATLFFLVAGILSGALTYGIIAGIVESLSRLVP